MRNIHGLIGCVVIVVVTTMLGVSDSARATSPSLALQGSWSCLNGPAPFLLGFHEGGTFNASGPELSTSVNYGVWEWVGGNEYASRDLAFIYHPNGNAELVQETTALTTLLDDDHLTADLQISVTLLDGTLVSTAQDSAICERITL